MLVMTGMISYIDTQVILVIIIYDNIHLQHCLMVDTGPYASFILNSNVSPALILHIDINYSFKPDALFLLTW